MTRVETKRIQKHLNRQGLGPLIEDGIYGPATESAYQRYLRLHTPIDPAPAPTAAKPWWTSRSVWGALITIGLSIAGIFIDVSAIDAGELTDVLVALSTGIAGLLALYGTLTRQAPIDPTLVAPGIRRPARRVRADELGRVDKEYYGDVPMRDQKLSEVEIADLLHGVDGMSKRMRTERMWPNTDAPEARNRNGLPDGPFFDNS